MGTPLSIQKELAEAYALPSDGGSHFYLDKRTPHCVNTLLCQTTQLAHIVQNAITEIESLRANDAEEIRAINSLHESRVKIEGQIPALSGKTDAIATRISLLETTTVTKPRVEAVETVLNAYTTSIAGVQKKIDTTAALVTQQSAVLIQVQAEQAALKKKQDFEAKLSECLQRGEETKARTASMTIDIATLKTASSQVVAKAAELEKRQGVVEERYISKAALEQHKQTTSTALDALGNSVSGLRKGLEDTTTKVEKQAVTILQIGRTQDAERESQKRAHELIQTQQAVAQKSIGELQAAASQATAKGAALEKIVSLKVDTATHDQQIAALKASQEEHARAFSCSVGKLTNTTEKEVDALKKALFQSNKDKKALEAKIDLMGREKEQLRSEMNKLQETVAMLVSSMKKGEKSKSSSRKKVKGLEQRIEVIDDRVTHGFKDVKERLNGHEKEIGDLHSKVSESALLTTAAKRRSGEVTVVPVSPRAIGLKSSRTAITTSFFPEDVSTLQSKLDEVKPIASPRTRTKTRTQAPSKF